MPFPYRYWRVRLSFGFRINLVLSSAYLKYRELNRLRDRSLEKRLALLLASLALLTAFVVMPPPQQP